MKRQTRYLFIILGLALFFVLGPLIVLYVSGVHYNWKDDEYVKTGIVSIKTDPSKADILLDGKKIDTSSANIRFLEPKEYTITLKKDGYFDWTKRIDIKASKATILAGALDKIYLLKNQPAINDIDNNVLDYVLTNNYLAYVTSSDMVIARGVNYKDQTITPLPSGINHLILGDNGQFILLTGPTKTLLFRVDTQQITDLTNQLKGHKDAMLTDDGIILFRDNSSHLLAYDPRTPTQNHPIVLLNQIDAYQLANGLLYYLQKDSAGAILHATSINGTAISNPQTLSITNLADTTDAKLYITNNKDIAIQKADSLYRVNASLELISTGVKQVFFYPSTRTLAYLTAGEFQQYDFNGNSASLVTRSGQDITLPSIMSDINYAFYFESGILHAIELDTRDRQNTYELSHFDQPKQITPSSTNKFMMVLDGDKLIQITIR